MAAWLVVAYGTFMGCLGLTNSISAAASHVEAIIMRRGAGTTAPVRAPRRRCVEVRMPIVAP
jgi:hypothetical protein